MCDVFSSTLKKKKISNQKGEKMKKRKVGRICSSNWKERILTSEDSVVSSGFASQHGACLFCGNASGVLFEYPRLDWLHYKHTLAFYLCRENTNNASEVDIALQYWYIVEKEALLPPLPFHITGLKVSPSQNLKDLRHGVITVHPPRFMYAIPQTDECNTLLLSDLFLFNPHLLDINLWIYPLTRQWIKDNNEVDSQFREIVDRLERYTTLYQKVRSLLQHHAVSDIVCSFACNFVFLDRCKQKKEVSYICVYAKPNFANTHFFEHWSKKKSKIKRNTKLFFAKRFF